MPEDKYNITLGKEDAGFGRTALNRRDLSQQPLLSLNVINKYVYEESRRELRYPYAANTYNKMSMQSDLSAAMNLVYAMINNRRIYVKAPPDSSKEDKEMAERINFSLMMMDRPFEEYILEAVQCVIYGFSLLEKIYTEVDTHLGNFLFPQSLAPISQASVDGWIFDRKTSALAGVVQDVNMLRGGNGFILNNNYPEAKIPKRKFLHFRHNPVRNNPEGSSAFRGCYITYKYLSIIEEFETIHATKGLGGILKLGIPASWLKAAEENPQGAEAKSIDSLKQSAANFNNGDQPYIIEPIAHVGNNSQFGVDILDTKQVETDKIIKRHSHRLLQCFFADVLQLGSNGSGSHSLSDNKTSLLSLGVNHILQEVIRILNHDLIRQVYELNNKYYGTKKYDPRTCARFVCDKPEDEDLESFAKSIQLFLAVDAMDRTEDVADLIRHKLELPKMSEAKTKVREVKPSNNTSRSGDGMAEGLSNGTGNSQANLGGSSVSDL